MFVFGWHAAFCILPYFLVPGGRRGVYHTLGGGRMGASYCTLLCGQRLLLMTHGVPKNRGMRGVAGFLRG